MINNPYFLYRQQILERNSSEENKNKDKKPEKIMDENEKVQDIDETCTLDPTVDVEVSCVNTEEKGKKPAMRYIHQGFEQIVPGVFQFKHSWQNTSPDVKTPQNNPAYHLPDFQLLGASDSTEAGFIRLDGIPGPYEHYQTPVYQFT